MPCPEAVYDAEERLVALADDNISQRNPFAELVAEPMRGASAIDRLAGAIEIAERPELIRRVPGIEGQLVDQPLDRAALRGVDILPAES